jgi:hypothetical protein
MQCGSDGGGCFNTSMITMMLVLISYKCTRAGEREVCNDGLLSIPANVMERELPFEQRFHLLLRVFFDRLILSLIVFHVPSEVFNHLPIAPYGLSNETCRS